MSLSEAERAIRDGRVRLRGKIQRQPLAPVFPGDEVRIDGVAVSLEAPTLALQFHKPADTVTTERAQHGARTVFDVLLPTLPEALARFRWHAAGRLDRDTTGLLLFTNDERLVAHLTRPDQHVPKRYVAEVQGTADEARVEPLRRGVRLEDGRARPAVVRVLGPSTVELTLTEGRHHQVKRMLAAVKLPVRALRREAVGGVTLDVPPGRWRALSEQEIRGGLGFRDSLAEFAPGR
jgi:23S rRNA pseudouridine2605 synthase/16S rRNA pseudouridine516 synthase